MKALLLNMKTFTIVKEFDSMLAAIEAQDNPEFQGFPKHLVERDNWDLGAADLVRFYNALPGVKTPVTRFADKATGMKRLLAALSGDAAPTTEDINPTQEAAPMAKAKVKKPKTEKQPRAPRKNGVQGTAVLKPTKAGTERRWHSETNRAKLFAHIAKKGECTVAEFYKYGTGTLGMQPGAVGAALGKLLDAKAGGGASLKMTAG